MKIHINFDELNKNVKRVSLERNDFNLKSWVSIVSTRKKEVAYCCQYCGVDLSSNKHLLKVIKKKENKLQTEVLCLVCCNKYRSLPLLNTNDSLLIKELKKEQEISDWEDVINNIDPKYYKLIMHLLEKGYSAPLVDYKVKNKGNISLTRVLLAWPATKVAISIETVFTIPGWRVLDLSEALSL